MKMDVLWLIIRMGPKIIGLCEGNLEILELEKSSKSSIMMKMMKLHIFFQQES